jgi:hypothetical protein
MKKLCAGVIVTAVVCAPTLLRAEPIASLYNTGVDALGTPASNLSLELHYSLTSVPSGPTGVRVATSANGFPLPPWTGDNTVSAWIGPNSDARLNGPLGSYDYRTTFNLAGLIPASANITGNWSVDDQGLDILLNGISTSTTAVGFQSFHAFTLVSGFVEGLNTLDFIVQNGGGPTGLRVEMVGTALARNTAIAEPASVALLGVGLVGLGAIGSKRSRRKSELTVCSA